MTTSAPPKHFRPQTDRAQKSVIRKINEAERAMIPPGFDAASEGTRSARTLAQVPLAAIDDQHIAPGMGRAHHPGRAAAQNERIHLLFHAQVPKIRPDEPMFS